MFTAIFQRFSTRLPINFHSYSSLVNRIETNRTIVLAVFPCLSYSSHQCWSHFPYSAKTGTCFAIYTHFTRMHSTNSCVLMIIHFALKAYDRRRRKTCSKWRSRRMVVLRIIWRNWRGVGNWNEAKEMKHM